MRQHDFICHINLFVFLFDSIELISKAYKQVSLDRDIKSHSQRNSTCYADNVECGTAYPMCDIKLFAFRRVVHQWYPFIAKLMGMVSVRQNQEKWKTSAIYSPRKLLWRILVLELEDLPRRKQGSWLCAGKKRKRAETLRIWHDKDHPNLSAMVWSCV